jgi:hypothetical protein
MCIKVTVELIFTLYVDLSPWINNRFFAYRHTSIPNGAYVFRIIDGKRVVEPRTKEV